MAARSVPSHNGPPMKRSTGSEPPSATLYLKNLPSKIRKPDVRMALYMLFATYGPVLDVVVMKTEKMRGQAHIVFRDAQTSTQAMRALQGFDFFGNELNIQYAKGRSHVFTKLEGVYRPPNVQDEPSAEASIFTAPAVTASTSDAARRTTESTEAPPGAATADTAQGTKRRRDEESDGGEASMEEDDDDDVSMEASSDED